MWKAFQPLLAFLAWNKTAFVPKPLTFKLFRLVHFSNFCRVAFTTFIVNRLRFHSCFLKYALLSCIIWKAFCIVFQDYQCNVAWRNLFLEWIIVQLDIMILLHGCYLTLQENGPAILPRVHFMGITLFLLTLVYEAHRYVSVSTITIDN